MEHISTFKKLNGCDIGFIKDNIYPADNYGRVGLHGLNKTFSLNDIIRIAWTMEEKPNILIKGGPNAKWYLKKFDSRIINDEIAKQNWRDSSRRSTMYIIEWDL